MSEEQVAEIKAAREKNRDKSAERRLHTLELYAQGMKRKEIALRTGIAYNYICPLVVKYRDGGLAAIEENRCGGNNRLLILIRTKKHCAQCCVKIICQNFRLHSAMLLTAE